MQVYDEQLQVARPVPLVVDLDGTLAKTDLLYESYLNSVSLGLLHQLECARALRGGKARLKQMLGLAGDLDYAHLPYDEAVLTLIRSARAEGRPVYLATASDRRHADGVAAHLGLFDGVFASDGTTNLSSSAKARTLVERFGRNGFDYVGNDQADLAVWSEARRAYAIRVSHGVATALAKTGVPVERLADLPASARTWVKAIRVHQWAKNALVFVPLLTAHLFTPAALATAVLAFVAFSLCASSAYVINDLIDLPADRLHPTKRKRPFASGAIPINQAVLAVPVLLGVAVVCAGLVSLPFAAVLASYFAITLAYSFSLKRKMLIDAVVLAMLYTLRVVGGAAAIGVPVSEWLLAFSMFIFLALALVKRYVELTVRLDQGLPDPSNRNYKLTDLPIVGALAAASGFNAVTIFTLYLSSPAVEAAYRHHGRLWLMCPILIYWIARVIMIAHRRTMNDDPMVFAIRDRNSQLAVLLMLVIVLSAI